MKIFRPCVVYSPRYPHAYQRIRSRVEMLVEDFPDHRVQVLCSTTARLVLRACDHLGVRCAVYGPRRMIERATSLVAFWDFSDPGVGDEIRRFLDRSPVEVYDAEFEGAGPRARSVLSG